MEIEVREARSDAERDAAYRLRHQVYVDELGLREFADPQREWVHDPEEDATGRSFLALLEGKPVGTVRLNWGGDGPFTQGHLDEFGLQPFLDLIGTERIVVMSRFAVPAEKRGGAVAFQLMAAGARFSAERQVILCFIDCEPHLISLYQRVGFRRCGSAYNDRALRLLVPLVFVADTEYLDRVGSPFADLTRSISRPARMPELLRLLAERGDATGADEQSDFQEVFHFLHERRTGSARLLEGFTEEEVRTLLAHSHRMRCPKGDVLIRKDHQPSTLFIVLSGTVEARLGERTVGYVEAGDCVGEISFLHGLPRTTDVYAATDDVEVVSLHRNMLQDLMKSDSELASRLLLNLSKSLSLRLLKANTLNASS